MDFSADVFIEDTNTITAIELKSVKPNSGEMKGEKQKILEKKIEIAVENRDILKWLFAVLFAIGFYGSLYGFHKWYKKILHRKKNRSDIVDIISM